jgi:hypothetical protein
MRDIVNLTPEIVACIGDVKGEAADYRQKKLLASGQARNLNIDPPSGANDESADEAPPTVSIAAPDALPKLHAQQREIIDRFVQCALSYIEKDYPLLEGESVEQDFASFLIEPFHRIPVSTAVIKRTTNMAELYYIITNVLVDENGDLYRVDPSAHPRLKAAKFDAKSLATKAAGKLVGSLASAIGGAIGSFIFDSLFPPGVPDYFDEVYQEISKLIGQGLQQNNITTINGAINSIKDHIVTEYEPARKRANLENKTDRKQLFDLLQKYDTTFISGPSGMLGTLQSEQYSLAGFGVFLLGASLQLSLFQEMANVAVQTDNHGKWLKPNQTSYGLPGTGTVASTARNFASYAERTWPRVLEARVKGVDIVTFEANKHVVSGDVYWELWGAINDHGQRVWQRQIAKYKEKDGSYPTMDQLRRDKDIYIDQVKNDLTQSYNDPNSIIQGWRKLIDQPILIAG